MQAGSTVLLTSEQDDEPLRVSFSTDAQALTAYWQATVTIINAGAGLRGDLQKAGSGHLVGSPIANSKPRMVYFDPAVLGDRVTISAGYKTDSSGQPFNAQANQIFDGHVFQPVWTRENVTDWKMTLRCMNGFMQDAQNPIQFNSPKNSSMLDILHQAAQAASLPVNVPDPDTRNQLDNLKLSRYKTFKDTPGAIFRQIAKDNQVQIWFGPHGINVRPLVFDPDTPPQFVFVPPGSPSDAGGNVPVTPTLLGVPEQTQEGIQLRVLLNAQVDIGTIIKVPPMANAPIQQFQVAINSFGPIPNPTGMYVVSAVRHVGDSRGHGGDWYTDITAQTANFFKPRFLVTAPNVG